MPDKITTDREVVHALIERLGRAGDGKTVGRTACGRVITGRGGWTAYAVGVDCRACHRAAARWTDEAPALRGAW